MRKPCNEQLCALAQKGDARAADLLLEHNSGFIRKTVSEIFLKSNLAEQEGCIGLLKAISSYDQSVGVKFLTYAAPFIRNAMTDLVRDAFSRYEQRMVDSENGLGLQKVRLDEVLPGEERLLRMEAVADIAAKSPEQVYEERETLREQTYLLYRYGFTDDIGHTLIGAAIHFHLSESRGQRSWKARQWTTSGWSCRGGFSAQTLRRDGGLYTFASASSQTPYPSLRRKRQSSLISSLLLSPQNL